MTTAVVIPLYNAQAWIRRALISVLEEGVSSNLLIVVDDGSTDESIAVVEQFGSKVILEKGPNRGASHARNRGLDIARERGVEYVTFLDADDYFEGGVFGAAVGIAREKRADMVVSSNHVEYEDLSRRLRSVSGGEGNALKIYSNWMRGDGTNPGSVLWRTGFIQEVGRWDETLARSEDFDVTLRGLVREPGLWLNPTGAAIRTRVNPVSLVTRNDKKSINDRFRATEKIFKLSRGTGFEVADALLFARAYKIAADAFASGEVAQGREILEFLKNCGYKENPGSPLHTAVAGAIGLEKKTKISSFFGNLRPNRSFRKRKSN